MKTASRKRFKLHYAWIMLGLCFLGLLAAQGVRLSFGAFVTPWETDFKADRATISLVSFISFIVYGLTQPVVGRLTDRYGVRIVLSVSVLLIGLTLVLVTLLQSIFLLMLLYGVVASLGFGGSQWRSRVGSCYQMVSNQSRPSL